MAGCVGAPEELELGEQSEALTLDEQLDPELQQAVDDAACYCEAWLLIPAHNSDLVPADLRPGFVDPPSSGGDTADARLRRYADSHRMGGQRVACGFAKNMQGKYVLGGPVLSENSPHGMLPLRQLSTQQSLDKERENNACISVKGSWSEGARQPETPNAPLCRSDFNYCMAQQLQIKAESLARSPSSRQARDAVLAEARTRFALSGNLLATAFTDTALDHCGTGPAPTPDQGAVCSEYYSCPNYSFGYDIKPYSSSADLEQPVCRWVCDGDGPCGRVCTPPTGVQCANIVQSRRNSLRDSIPAALTGPDGRPLRDHVQISGTVQTMKCRISGTTPAPRSDDAPPCSCKTRVHLDNVECTRFNGPYGNRALTRAVDTMSQIGELTQREARSRMAAGDALAVGTASGSLGYGDQVWGAESPRLAAAMTIAGKPSTLPAAAIPAYARNVVTDGKAEQLLQLLDMFDVVIPYRVCADGTQGLLTLNATQEATWYPRILSAIGVAARARFGLPSQGAPADLVRGHLGLNEVDVAAALRLLRDQIAVFDLDYTLTPEEPDPGNATCDLVSFARNEIQTGQRSALPLVATLAQPGNALSQWLLDGWLKASAEQIRPLGGSGQLYLLRKNLMQLRNRHPLTAAQQTSVADAITIADAWAGDSWTDYQYSCYWTCNGTWRAHGNVVSAGATLGLAASAEAARCLVQGHAPGTPRTSSCAPGAFTPVTTYSSPSNAFWEWSGRPNIAFDVPEQQLGMRHYVMERSCDSAGNNCRYRLVDVIDGLVDDTVHTVGGQLNELLERVLAKTPADPAQPLYNALDKVNGQVPSLSFGFTGTVIDDWYRGYVTDAASTAKEVKQRLDEQVATEVQVIQQEITTGFQAQNLELAQRSVLTKACGDNPAGNCAVERVPSISFGELGLVPAPGPDPGGAESGQSCLDFLATFEFAVPDDDIKEYVEKNLKAGLRCTHWATLVLASETTVFDLPVSVRDQLVAGAETAVFADLGGEVRTEHINLFNNLHKLGIALRQFDVTYQLAKQQLDNALQRVDDGEPGWWQQFSCYSQRILVAAAAVAAAYVAAGPILAGGIGTAALAALKSGSLMTGGAKAIALVDSLVNIGECSNNDGAQLAARDAFAQTLASMEQLRQFGDQAGELVAIVALSDEALDQLEAQIAIADARARIELALLQTGAHFDPAWRFMQTLRAEETRSLLHDAQRKLFDARTAVEFRTGEDLRFISSSTAFPQGSPSSWANGLFALDFPAGPNDGAVGALAAIQVGLYAQRIYDFMHSNYNNYRPFRLGETTRIVRLSEILNNLRAGTGSAPIYELMSFRCANTSDWLVGGRRSTDPVDALPCASTGLGGVVEARVSFDVPAPYRGYFRAAFQVGNNANYRISSIGLNILGSGIQVCTQSNAPWLCQDNKDVPYTLRHGHDVWIESLAGQRRSYTMTPGVIQAEARAREEPINSTNVNLMQPFEARQLKDRPLSGSFTLQFANPTYRQIQWANLEDIQMVVKYEHWIPQL